MTTPKPPPPARVMVKDEEADRWIAELNAMQERFRKDGDRDAFRLGVERIMAEINVSMQDIEFEIVGMIFPDRSKEN